MLLILSPGSFPSQTITVTFPSHMVSHVVLARQAPWLTSALCTLCLHEMLLHTDHYHPKEVHLVTSSQAHFPILLMHSISLFPGSFLYLRLVSYEM